MTFWQLVRTPHGYALCPYITIYEDMVEIQLHGEAARGLQKSATGPAPDAMSAGSDQ